MGTSADPTGTFESKLLAFAETLTDDERIVMHDLLHLASNGSAEVEGFRMPSGSLPADPCEGGEVTFPNTFNMLGNLHTGLHQIRQSRLPKFQAKLAK